MAQPRKGPRKADFLLDAIVTEHGTRKSSEAADLAIADSIRASLTAKQAQVLDDPHRRKAVLCPRRAGKSWTAMSYAFDTALRRPLSRVVIVCLTLKSAKQIYWQGASSLLVFAKKFGIRLEPHLTDVRVTLANGSIISFIGAETKAEIEKLRGGSYDLVVIDECKSYPGGILDELIKDVLVPALRDRKGTLLLIGTPGSILAGPFYEATCPGVRNPKGRLFSRFFESPEAEWVENPPQRAVYWSRHAWTVQDNTAVPHLWEEALEEKAFYGWDDDHPSWLRESMGQWVASSDAFVYAYATLRTTSPQKVHWVPERTPENPAGLPAGHDDWRFILGIDLGFEDDTALVVGAYSPTSGVLYHVWDYKSPHMLPEQLTDWIRRVIDRFGMPDAIVADMGHGGSKMLVEGINARYGILIQPAERRDKYDHIEFVNNDFHSGRIKILENSDLALELSMLQWDLTHADKSTLAKQGKLKEHYDLANHLADAFLYLHRFSNHFWGAPRTRQLVRNTPEYWDSAEDEWMKEYIRKRDNPTDPLLDSIADMRSPTDPLRRFYR